MQNYHSLWGHCQAAVREETKTIGADIIPIGADTIPVCADTIPIGKTVFPIGADIKPMIGESYPVSEETRSQFLTFQSLTNNSPLFWGFAISSLKRNFAQIVSRQLDSMRLQRCR
jgi:hypothetical protein